MTRTRGFSVLLAVSLAGSAWQPALAAGEAGEEGASGGDQDAASVGEMLTGGKLGLNLRYRYENVDQDGFADNANASTLRSRINFQSADYRGLSFLAEVDNVAHIGSTRFNDTDNGATRYPVVADPEGTEANQAWLRYARGGASGTYGRQRILHGGQRFVGGVAWRQNEQTYDGFRARWAGADLDLDYAYVYNVNRIFGPDDTAQPADWHGENHLLRADYELAEGHRLAGYYYGLDIDPQGAYSAGQVENNSSETWGLSYHGTFGPVSARASYARQDDGGQSELDYSANYYVVEGSVPLGGLAATLGYEVLGSGDGVGFKTPLATLHKFQGWADMFLATPGDGIEDLYGTLAGSLGRVALTATWHEFSAEEGGADFGSELDLQASLPLHENLKLQLIYASFSSDAPARYPDTDKAWLVVTFNY